MQILTHPRGTRDFYPEEMALREHIFTSWDRTCQRYGFEKFDAPLFEHLDLFTQKSGEEIEKQLYTFKDKSGRWLALRPEITPSLARMVAAKGSSLKLPVRWYSIPRLFRYEKMQKGRLREFFQLNADILGISQVTADAELIAVSIDTMIDLGFGSSDFTVHISSRDLLEELFLNLQINKNDIPSLFTLLDKHHKISKDAFHKDLKDFLNDQITVANVLGIFKAKSLDDLKNYIRFKDTLPKSLAELETLFKLLDSYGMGNYVKFDIGIVRGLAYYTGIVFELLDKKRDLRSIAGGGRYDRLVKLYGGPDTPAAGFATGDVVLMEMMREKGIVPKLPPRSSVYLVTLDKKNREKVIAQAHKLRCDGISCEFALKPLSVGKQMKLADAARAKIVLFTGGDEEKEGMLKMRDMRSGEEKLIPLDTISDIIHVILHTKTHPPTPPSPA